MSEEETKFSDVSVTLTRPQSSYSRNLSPTDRGNNEETILPPIQRRSSISRPGFIPSRDRSLAQLAADNDIMDHMTVMAAENGNLSSSSLPVFSAENIIRQLSSPDAALTSKSSVLPVIDSNSGAVRIKKESSTVLPPLPVPVQAPSAENASAISKPEEEDDSDQKKKVKFRSLARKIKANLMWTRELQEKHENTLGTSFVVNGQNGGETLTFDMNNYRTSSRTYGGISLRAKAVLLKNSLRRTEEDLLLLRDVVNRLKCFDKYSRTVKHELARVISYETFDDGRVIIQQGHMGLSFYFIVSGSVIVKLTEEDKTTGRKHTQLLGELTEGMSFGELALLHNIRRTATIVCKGTSEFLRVDKPDFDMVLSVSYQSEWKERYNALRRLPSFKGFTDKELEEINHSCKMVEYNGDKVVFSQREEVSDYVYFVWNGVARVVRDYVVRKEIFPGGKYRYILLGRNENNLLERSGQRHGFHTFDVTERHLLTVCMLDRGLFFGAGEDLRATYIVSREKLECLMVPRVHFMKCGRSFLLDDMRKSLDTAMPTDQKVFSRYVKDKAWDNFKQDIVKEIVSRHRIPNSTTIQDVPLEIRLTNTRG